MLSTSANGDDKGCSKSLINEDMTVDDIFTHLTVQQIQKLNKEYIQNVTNARDDLHGLVGNKYRDLIKIAEDISNMYQITSEIDHKLSDLSYKQSEFVSFSVPNSLAKYNSSIRSQEVQEVREKENSTILANIINDKLLPFDIKLLSSNYRAPLRNTSNYLYYAKCFYTIEAVFANALSKDNHLSDKLQNLKASFVSHLRTELSGYNVFNTSSYSHDVDKYKRNQSLNWKDIIDSSKSYLLDGDMDSEEYNDDDDLSAQELGYDEELDFEESLHDSRSKALPIVNYLISYIILNQKSKSLDSLPKILDDFIELRYNFLNDSFSKILSNVGTEDINHINFFKIFKYIENTCDYIARYFETINTRNGLSRNFKQVSGSWKAPDLIGFNNWFENDEVVLSQDLCDATDISLCKNKGKLDRFPTLLSAFCDDLIELIFKDRSNKDMENLTNMFFVFHNFITSLRKLETSIIANGSTSKLIDLITNSGKNTKSIVTDLLDKIIFKTKSVYMSHFDILLKDSNAEESVDILSYIKHSLTENTFDTDSSMVELFSAEVAETMDDDLNKYIDSIARISSLPSMSTSSLDVCNRISEWFETYIGYKYLIAFDKESDWSGLSSANYLRYLSDFLLNTNKPNNHPIKFGNFSYELLSKEFTTLNEFVNEILCTKINDLIKNLRVSAESNRQNSNLKALYYLLQILITMKDKLLSFYEGHKDQHEPIIESIGSLDEICKEIFSSVVNIIPVLNEDSESSFLDSVDQFVDDLVDSECGIHALESTFRPSLRLSSLMFHLSSKYLSPFLIGHSDDYKFGKIFLNKNARKLFSTIKNEWLLESIIEDKIIKKLDQCSTSNMENKEITNEEMSRNRTTGDNGTSTVLSQEKLHLMFANIVYLLQFTSDEPVNDLSHPLIEEHIKKLNEVTADKLFIDEKYSKAIVKSVAEFYKSNKGIYIPLSIS